MDHAGHSCSGGRSHADCGDHIRRAWKTGAYDDERRKKAKAKNSYTEKEMTITEKFRDINIQVADDMDVKLVESDDDKCHVTYFDSPDVIHSVTVQDDALVMTCADNRTFGSDMGFGDDPYVVVSIPEESMEIYP